MFNCQYVVRSLALLVIFSFQLLIVNPAIGQVKFQEQYAYGKRLFQEGKYSLAMETLKPVIAYDASNPFPEYASYYYALSAYQLGYTAVSRDMFNQIKSLYPSWDKADEVTLWLAKIHFDKAEYSQGIQLLMGISNSKIHKEVEVMMRNALSQTNDVILLKSLYEKYPQEVAIGERLAEVLSKNPSLESNQLLSELIQKFHLKKSDFIEETPQSIHRDKYSVALLFPFVVNTLEPTPTRKRNQFVLDMYEGMKLAVDTLAKQGIKISLRAYDTERNADKLKKLLERNELRNTDLIVGPLFQEENNVVQEFSRINQINLFNPLSNNVELISRNPYGFLFQPSFESIGTHSAKFLAKYQVNKKCIVFYGESKRDSTLAANFVKTAKESGLRLLRVEKISKEASKKVNDILATPTEFDEFKYPKQFTLPKDSLGCVYVASDDPLIYTKVISSVETRGDNATVLGFESWLDQSAVNYEKYQRLNIIVAAPNYTSPENAWYKAFQRKFIKSYGRTSSTSAYTNYAKLGYDFMLFVGNSLKKNGVYFQESLQKQKWSPGFLIEGYDYTGGRDNHSIPFIKFDGGKLVVIDKQ